MYTDEKHAALGSPAEAGTYFPDDKIVFVSNEPIPEASRQQFTQQQSARISVAKCTPRLPEYTEPLHEREPLPEREPVRRPFLKRHMIWLIVGLLLIIVLAGVIIGVVASRWSGKKASSAPNVVVPNNTNASVASSGLFVNSGKTWNMQTYALYPNGTIWYRMSLDGLTFQPQRNASLKVRPKIGSPLSAVAVTDATGVVYLSMFYIADTQQIAQCVVACALGSSICTTMSNIAIPTSTPISNFTGIAGVNVDNAQDWRIYYNDENGFLREMLGDASGFKDGTIVGGVGLNNTAIAGINVNQVTNNIVLFFSDAQTSALYSQQFANGGWTIGQPLSTQIIPSWDPTSGLGVAYSKIPDQLHVYYTGLDTLVYEFVGSSASQTTNTSWSAQPTTQKVWGPADNVGADITAVGWDDQVRTFQRGHGTTVESLLSNSTWTQKFLG